MSVLDYSNVPEEEDMGGNGEEDWGGIASETEEVEQDSGPRQGGESVNKPPTRDELRAINEASELYKSNTFKLAVRVFAWFMFYWSHRCIDRRSASKCQAEGVTRQTARGAPSYLVFGPHQSGIHPTITSPRSGKNYLEARSSRSISRSAPD